MMPFFILVTADDILKAFESKKRNTHHNFPTMLLITFTAAPVRVTLCLSNGDTFFTDNAIIVTIRGYFVRFVVCHRVHITNSQERTTDLLRLSTYFWDNLRVK